MICSTSVIMLNLRYKLMVIDCIYGSKIRLLKKFKALTSRRRGEGLLHYKLPRHKWLAQSIKSLPTSANNFMDFHFFERKKTAKRKTNYFLRLMDARKFYTVVIHMRFANFFALSSYQRFLISIKKNA